MITVNPSTGEFLSLGGPGLDLETEGWDYFTREGGKRVYATDVPYKVIPHFEICDEAAKAAVFFAHHEWEASYAERTDQVQRVPDGRHLFDYQQAGTAYTLRRRNSIIGDEPGLGKTAQAVAFCNAVADSRVLVVCPASLRLNWGREIRSWTTKGEPSIYPVCQGDDGINPFADFTIVSYDLCRNRNIFASLTALDWDVLILDEAHYLKTPEASRTRAVLGSLTSDMTDGVLAKAKRTLALTGTPLPNRPRECYTLVRALNWDAFDRMSEAAFQDRYNPSYQWQSGGIDERTGHLPEMRARLRCNLMVRRKKADVLSQLPPKRYELVWVEEDAAIRRALEAERLLDFDPIRDMENAFLDAEGHIATIRRLMSEAMAPRIASHCASLIDGGLDKLGIGYYHRTTGDILQEQLRSYGLVRVDGRDTVKRRQDRVDMFQNDPQVRIFLGQYQAAGVGHTLTAASHTVVADPSWVPGENEQWIDRFHRIGQNNAVLAQFPVAPTSWNERILGRAIEKLKVTTEALDG